MRMHTGSVTRSPIYASFGAPLKVGYSQSISLKTPVKHDSIRISALSSLQVYGLPANHLKSTVAMAPSCGFYAMNPCILVSRCIRQKPNSAVEAGAVNYPAYPTGEAVQVHYRADEAW